MKPHAGILPPLDAVDAVFHELRSTLERDLGTTAQGRQSQMGTGSVAFVTLSFANTADGDGACPLLRRTIGVRAAERGTGTVATTFLLVPPWFSPRSQSPFFREPCDVVLAGSQSFSGKLPIRQKPKRVADRPSARIIRLRGASEGAVVDPEGALPTAGQP